MKIGGYTASCPKCGSVDIYRPDAFPGDSKLRCRHCGHIDALGVFGRRLPERSRRNDHPPIIGGMIQPIYPMDD